MLGFSAKQKLSIKESNARINIWEGAVRSGKTFASLWRFLAEIAEGPQGDYVIICRTFDSFKRNVLGLLHTFIGVDAHYSKGNRELNIYGKTIHIVGADDERAESKIRGPTFYGAYVDEATIIPESVWNMLISRCAMGGAKIFATTNPDSPYHWLKANFIDNNPDVKTWQFNLEDNPQITLDEKDYLKRQYHGIWYKRYIDGLWVQAEGAIYDCFDPALHCLKVLPDTVEQYIVGVDYGTTNPCAFVCVGVDRRKFPNTWVAKEYYFDSKVSQRQKTDSEYAEDLKRFIYQLPVSAIYIDPSAVSFRIELRRMGIDNIFEAKNDVLDGIRFTNDLISNGTLKIGSECINLVKELQSYAWDMKAGQRGIEKPLKQNDHCFAAGTQIITKNGPKSIEYIQLGEEILTSGGLSSVCDRFERNAEVYKYNILGIEYFCTNSHKFFTLNRGFTEIGNVLKSDIFLVNLEDKVECAKQLNGTVKDIEDIQKLKDLMTEIILEDLNKKNLDISIEMCGNSIMEQFHQDTIFITKIGIPLTTTLAIWNYSHLKNILPIMDKILQKNKNGLLQTLKSLQKEKQQIGIDRKRDINGTKNMEKTLETLSQEAFSVTNAEMNIKLKNYPEQDFVRISVKQNGEEILALMMRKDYANFVLNSMLQVNLKKDIFAQSPVEKSFIGESKVYNLTVVGLHEYYANNVLVANCVDALRYAVYTHLFGKDQYGASKPDFDKLYHETRSNGPELPHFFRDDGNQRYGF